MDDVVDGTQQFFRTRELSDDVGQAFGELREQVSAKEPPGVIDALVKQSRRAATSAPASASL